ncbi:hypothetical protein GO755_34700 [Spirosoma sp. HMF4905]|uniref:Uncharacterized protein n=1 Tax=Spirosoma arboris TaxID=2682092 RepID=A0A7K1SN46_9BACT|nr:hypothetical protein [Spirosoma arboris]MVM35224.1 hypothetical protein [Spirosoma arboris]
MNGKPHFVTYASHYCCTVPVSTTGSLWAGYGGWHYRACSFLISKRSALHKFHYTNSTCQFIPPTVNYVSSSFPSRPLRSVLRTWRKIDDPFVLPGKSRKLAA